MKTKEVSLSCADNEEITRKHKIKSCCIVLSLDQNLSLKQKTATIEWLKHRLLL